MKFNDLSKAPELINIRVIASSLRYGVERSNNLSGNYRFSGIRAERPYYKVFGKIEMVNYNLI